MAGRRPRLLVSLSIVALVLGAVPPTVAAVKSSDLTAKPLTPTSRVTTGKALSSRLAESDPDLLGRTDASPVAVMIKLDYDAIAAYAGGIDGLAATSPSVTGRKLTGNSPAERAYGRYVSDIQNRVVRDLRSAVPSAAIGTTVQVVFGGFAAVIPANSVQRILSIPGVSAVQSDSLAQPLTDSSPAFIGAPAAYSQLGTTANAGQGLILGNLDTGVWPEHPSFADLGNLPAPPGPARVCNFGDNPQTPAVDVFVCNNKLIGGQPFLATYLSNPTRAAAEPFHSARDSNGHGTHTSSTSAGNMVASAPIFGIERGPIHGLAPGAYVMEYKVCGIQGCFSSDTADAVEQAILDGVNVINFSISGGTDPYSDPTELAFLDAYAAGVFVSASAGNEGPGAGTANHLSPWTTSVAASTQTREFATTLHLTAGNGDTFSVDGASITTGVGPLPVVKASAAPYSNALCTAPAPAGTFTGKIVACQRGTNGRIEKGFNVLQGGAAGMILYNPTLADIETDNHFLPTVHVADGTALLAFLNSHTGVTGSFAAGAARNGQGDVMAAFSSRGPGGLFIKPDVTAPGVQILAGTTPVPDEVAGGSPGQLYMAIAGTSMSSPHVAGAALLVRAVHPSWTPGQVRSALMTTALTSVLKEDLATPADPFDLGAGRITVSGSIGAALAFDETATNFFLLGSDPLNAVHANLPSINAPVMPGRIVTHRTATNVSGQRIRVNASATAPADSSITVSPDKFNLNPGEAVVLTITIESSAPIGSQRFGSVRLSAGGSEQHLPVAFIHTQGTVSLGQGCAAASIAKRQATSCVVTATNNSFDDQTVNLRTTTSSHLDIVGATGATVVNLNLAQRLGVTLAGAQPGVPSVDPGTSPAGGYLPLSLFGIAPISIGDEDILNFSVPPFVFNGQTWNAVGVDSNGYVVVGGGTSEDNNCCLLPAGPDPARPNNMLAPLWTDLDGTGAAGIFAGTLTDGADTWIVLEWQVKVFGTNDLRKFQTWIGVTGDANPGQDISYTYSAAQANPNGQDFLVGAENVIGQGEVAATLPTGDLVVTSTDPVPGDSVSYTVLLEGKKKGTGVVTTEMVANGVPGTTIVKSTIEVTN